MKKNIITFLLTTITFILSGCHLNQNKNINTLTEQNTYNTSQEIEPQKIHSEPASPLLTPTPEAQTSPTTEILLSEFETEIKTKSQNRLNNIQITCNKLNDKTIAPHTEFSFCETIGKSTEEEGYKKADVIINKKTVQALGGGNCQVSSTLYNAVLTAIENGKTLEVTERHPHGKKVTYVPEGKDAAIAHGSKDLKFKNNSDKTLKIKAEQVEQKVKIQIFELSNSI